MHFHEPQKEKKSPSTIVLFYFPNSGQQHKEINAIGQIIKICGYWSKKSFTKSNDIN